MARRVYYSWVCNDEGQPVSNVTVDVYQAGSTDTPANIYLANTGGSPVSETTTDAEGYFEFWIADTSGADLGYASDQKFRIDWSGTGITSGYVDYVNIFSPAAEVDETDTDTTKNKTVSNAQANQWSQATVYTSSYTSNASWTVTHSLGSYNIIVQCWNNTHVWIEPTDITQNSINQCTVTFGGAQVGRVVVICVD